MSEAFAIRAVQLDLARQMETLDWIKGFIDFAARFGYNAIHLYLEGRVRTPSFPWRAAEFSYTPEELRQIVEYAAAKGLDVQPQVNCFGHVEQFLACDELKPLGELREGIKGRFGSGDMAVFCPSLDATYDFLARYLAEVAAIFPSPYFHVGCDEVWQMGYCSKCRARLEAGETYGDLFAKHIVRLHGIVHGQLGKRMMMWDDMWEEFPEAVAAIPKDIIQCVWQYDAEVDPTKTHFGRRRQDHRLSRYAELGFESLFCPAAWNIRNTASGTRYFRPFKVLGGLMTTWELSHSFLYNQYPGLAFAGRRWADLDATDADLFAGVLDDLFGVRDPMARQALLTAASRSFPRGTRAPEAELRGSLTQTEWDAWQDARLCLAVLSPLAAGTAASPARDVLADLLAELEAVDLASRLRQYAQDVYRYWTQRPAPPLPTLVAEGEAIVAAIGELRGRRREQWSRWRTGLAHERGGEIYQAWEEAVAAFVARVKADNDRRGLLRVRYALPDYYGSQQGEWQVQYADSRDWEPLAAGTPKPRGHVADETPLYVIEYPLPAGREPRRLRFLTCGYGGVGIAYLDAWAVGRRQVPAAIGATVGKVRDAAKILRDDTFWCTLGEEDTEYVFTRPALAEATHSLEIELESQALPWAGA